ncbi:MAG: nucleoside phosphorylase [Bacteroidales bacterium]|jgi:uridine phosphorylase|nr:nucleoside phosphorylase [Bacteroidales bacterium]
MKETELITNDDGSIFHLRLRPGEAGKKIIIVGDPGRVDMLAQHLDNIRVKKSNREFFTVTGNYGNKEISIISSGIGTDNIDILLNELDAIFNYNLETGQERKEKTSLTIVRLGTSGGLQPELYPGEPIISEKAIGFDSVMNYYRGIEAITDPAFESAFMSHTSWHSRLPRPYIVDASKELLDKFSKTGFVRGMTISTPGFYAPQGRMISLEPVDKGLNDKIMTFTYKGRQILNYEMESSAIYGLSSLLGHKAITICLAIGNRVSGKFLNDYKPLMNELAVKVMEII